MSAAPDAALSGPLPDAVPANPLSAILAGRGIRGVFIVLAGLWLTVTVALPLFGLLSKSLYATDGHYVGLGNFLRFFTEPTLFSSLTHSLWVSTMTTLAAVPLAFVYAYGMCRSDIRGKTVFKALAMSPLFAPTLMHGIVLVYLFGKKGLVTTGFFGHAPGFDISLYGHVGIIIAEALYAFPPSFLILSTALSLTEIGRAHV